ncbi:MAG TPA: phosphoribosylformylglycinamidine synthase subunit PurQ [Firmicutes bacterium]|nr:phosphoribosylformylglycinamidine synthase subunit PurQ [Bacillota bacterium]
MKVGVVVFPGSNCDADVRWAVEEVGGTAEFIWHAERSLDGFDAVILPGGFSYGDYLRCGAIARFSPIMAEVARFAEKGNPVLGICNGFQILTEAGLLPGVLRRNAGLRFICRPVHVRVENAGTAWTRGLASGTVLRLPIAHGEGNYYAAPEELAELERQGQVVFRYVDEGGSATEEANPNGSANNIAGVCNRAGNVVGLMPHPERAVTALLGGEDGRAILGAVLRGEEVRAC